MNFKVLRKYEKARECFKKAITLDRDNDRARDNLASIYGK